MYGEVCTSENVEQLLDRKMDAEARMTFPYPAALRSVGEVLVAITSRSRAYKFTQVSSTSLAESKVDCSKLRERIIAGSSLPLLKRCLSGALTSLWEPQ